MEDKTLATYWQTGFPRRHGSIAVLRVEEGENLVIFTREIDEVLKLGIQTNDEEAFLTTTPPNLDQIQDLSDGGDIL
jgi:hypothetical protein